MKRSIVERMIRCCGWVAYVGLCFAAVLCMVLPAAASTSGPVIYQLQVGATGITNKEYISVYNNSQVAVDVTDWCIKYSTAASTTSLGCLTAPDGLTRLWLPAHGYVTAASNAFKADYPSTIFDIAFPSASIAAKDRAISLVDGSGTEVDKLGWGTAVAEGTPAVNPVSPNILQRLNLDPLTLKDTDNNMVDFGQITAPTLAVSSVYEVVTPTDVCTNLDGLQTELPLGYLQDEAGNCQLDMCLNIDGLQTNVPAGYESLDGENCTSIPLENATLLITELLPNATSYDTGNEFIEIYNPNNRPINLKGYTLQLGPDYAKSYPLPDQMIEPGAYHVFSDTETGVVLPNSSATVRLVAPSDDVVSLSAVYDQPAENTAWALIDGLWQYTNRGSPGSANLPMLVNNNEEEAVPDTELTPCRADQERNPDTNRCRLIQLAAASLTACQPGQERNPATNRCRSLLSASSDLVPCKEGQERNPETNRCRSVLGASTDALTPCAAGQERNPETNRCRKAQGAGADGAGLPAVKDVASGSIGKSPKWLLASLAVVSALGYAAYEWRQEVFRFTSKLRHKFVPTRIK